MRFSRFSLPRDCRQPGPETRKMDLPQKFTSLSWEDSERPDRQRAVVVAAVKRRYGVTLTRSPKNLARP